jgi:D-lactate dehydrogenase
MKQTKINFFEINEKWQEVLIKKELSPSQFAVAIHSGKITPASIKKIQDSEVISVFIHSQVNKPLLDKLPRLRLIATNSTGYDHIDLAEAKRRKIVVSNVPVYGENTVAEHTFALILALSRKIVDSAVRTRQGRFYLHGLRGFDLKGKTIGVVGTGHIGQHVIRIAHGFEMKILAHDLHPDQALENHYPLKYVSLENLLKNSDIVTLHAPLLPATRHLINKKNIKLFKKGSILINTARGGLVETEALLWAIKHKIISEVGLDVLEEEGVISEDSQIAVRTAAQDQLASALAGHRLISLDNVLVTPHNAFNSNEAIHRIITTTLENIKAWKTGRPINTV